MVVIKTINVILTRVCICTVSRMNKDYLEERGPRRYTVRKQWIKRHCSNSRYLRRMMNTIRMWSTQKTTQVTAHCPVWHHLDPPLLVHPHIRIPWWQHSYNRERSTLVKQLIPGLLPPSPSAHARTCYELSVLCLKGTVTSTRRSCRPLWRPFNKQVSASFTAWPREATSRG